jgi:hypothetical protein
VYLKLYPWPGSPILGAARSQHVEILKQEQTRRQVCGDFHIRPPGVAHKALSHERLAIVAGRSIEEHGDVASATVDEENFGGSVSFTDVFSLARIDGNWQIVGKIFTHTGGTPPGA